MAGAIEPDQAPHISSSHRGSTEYTPRNIAWGGYGPLRTKRDRGPLAASLGRGANLAGSQSRPARLRRLRAEVLCAGDAPVPLRRPARRPPEELRDRGRDRSLPAPQRVPGGASDGLRRIRL